MKSIEQQILAANTDAEVDAVLKTGEGYKDAAPKTRKRWTRAAAFRKRQLAGATTATKPPKARKTKAA